MGDLHEKENGNSKCGRQNLFQLKATFENLSSVKVGNAKRALYWKD